MDKIIIYTDGACSGNPGPGGWGVRIEKQHKITELYGGTDETTNNRMELTATIEAVNATPAEQKLIIYTDSQYVRNGITQWLEGWKRKGWRTSNNKRVKNQDLWKALDEATKQRDIKWQWVRSHDGNPGNERADELARKGMAEYL